MSHWEIALVIVRLGLYGSTALVFGGVLGAWSCRTRNVDLHYINRLTLWGALSGAILSAVSYLLSVGQFSDIGMDGLFDIQMMNLLWDSDIGQQSQWRITGFLLLLVAGYLTALYQHSLRPQLRVLPRILAALGLFAVLFSYTLTGHTAQKDVLATVSLMAHVAFITWWVGCVIALIQVCDRHQSALIKAIMNGFGRTATLFVPVIVLYGIALMVQIIPSWKTFSQPYGIALLIKLGVFVLVLGLAARHRFLLVPQLSDAGSVTRLKQSIVLELVLLLVILTLTAVLSSTMGAHATP